MKYIHLRPQGPEWLRWRAGGIGASDAPAILGVSPFAEQTPLALWRRLTRQGPPIDCTYAMRRGQVLEPVARRMFEISQEIEVVSVCGQHDELDWMRASFDGIDLLGETIVEIKCPDHPTHAEAAAGGAPAKYRPQIQHQLAVSGAARCAYVSLTEHRRFGASPEKPRIAIVWVEPDTEYIRRLIEIESEFWQCVLERREPGKKEASVV